MNVPDVRVAAAFPASIPARIVRSDIPLLTTIVSGGQCGVDQCALRAGTRLGLSTGGHAPHNWMTLDGPAPWLANYGLVESSWGYAGRTSANVRDSDATVRIARDFCSTGEICTYKAIRKWERPYFDVDVGKMEGAGENLVAFLIEHKVRVLNVAGNSEKTCKEVGLVAEEFLVRTLGGMK